DHIEPEGVDLPPPQLLPQGYCGNHRDRSIPDHVRRQDRVQTKIEFRARTHPTGGARNSIFVGTRS
ncbi:MAG: hypothetical protein ACKOSQ_08675, partial [Planctomycetaceae bacterium]